MAVDLDRKVRLATADRYSNPRDPSALLPISYGDWLDPAALPADDEDGGITPCVSIDRLNRVYCVNDAPAGTAPPKVYVNDTVQSASVYAYNPAIDYESTGVTIAALQFLVDPGEAEISVRFQGTVDGSGSLITNPVAAIKDFFVRRGGWTLGDFDPTSCTQSQYDLLQLNEQMRWCFAVDETPREWLRRISPHYHMDFGMADDRLALRLDRSMTAFPPPIAAEFDAALDCLSLDGQGDGVRYWATQDDLITKVRLRWRGKWTTGETLEETDVPYTLGINLYGDLRQTFDLPGMYTDTHASRWLAALFLRQGILAPMVEFHTRYLHAVGVGTGQFIAFTWPRRNWQRRLLKVLNVEIDLERQTQRFTCLDCRRNAPDPVSLPIGALPPRRRRRRTRLFPWKGVAGALLQQFLSYRYGVNG